MSFLNNMYTVFIQVLILAIMIVVGFCGDKFGYFPEKASRMSTNLLFYIVTPCVIIDSFMKVEFNSKNAVGLLIATVCTVVLHLFGMVYTRFLFNKGDSDKNAIYKYASMYGNMGYMGLPLSKAVLDAISGSGDLGVFYCSAACAVFNIFSFTHGISIMSKEKNTKFDFKKLIINPGALGVIIGLPIFLLNIKVPAVIATPISSIGSMNTPFAMIMLGTYFAKANLKEAFCQKNIYISALVKLIINPLILISLFRLCGLTGNTLIAVSIFVSTPTASNTAMFAAKYGRDASLASQVCGFSTLLSIITMPVCVALAAMIA